MYVEISQYGEFCMNFKYENFFLPCKNITSKIPVDLSHRKIKEEKQRVSKYYHTVSFVSGAACA